MLLLTTGLVGVVGVAHPQPAVSAALGQLTTRLWQLNRRVRDEAHPTHPALVQHARQKRRLTL